MIKEVFLTTLTGAGVGAVFAVFKLPVPAPPVFAGVMGIVGLWIGYGLIQRFI
jgi:XapX domain-containing protein